MPTESNLADDPSREKYNTFVSLCPGIYIFASCLFTRYGLLDVIAREVDSTRIDAMLDDTFLQAQTWEALSVLGVF